MSSKPAFYNTMKLPRSFHSHRNVLKFIFASERWFWAVKRAPTRGHTLMLQFISSLGSSSQLLFSMLFCLICVSSFVTCHVLVLFCFFANPLFCILLWQNSLLCCFCLTFLDITSDSLNLLHKYKHWRFEMLRRCIRVIRMSCLTRLSLSRFRYALEILES